MKTTKKQFDYFKERCSYWRDKLGLRNWYFNYNHGEDDEDGYYARYELYYGARTCLLYFTSTWDCEELQLTNKSIDRVAFHECCEILVQELANFGLNRGCSNEEITEVKHKIVRTLENLLYE